ncbi:Uncharacterised protein [Vibrio cholerae]|nr:Uncharacterised protein [Vibrio cholerae]
MINRANGFICSSKVSSASSPKLKNSKLHINIFGLSFTSW